MRVRAAVLLVPVVLAPAMARAQGRTVDEGTLEITRAGAGPAVESFKIVRFGGDSIVATGQLMSGTRRTNSRLTTDTLGTPISYEYYARNASREVDRVRASARAGRLLLLASDEHGRESQREFPVVTGGAVMLDPELLHQLYFLPLAPHPRAIFVIRPREVRGAEVTLASLGFEPLSIGGRSVTSQHYALGAGADRVDLWVDAAGRVLRVAIPAEQLDARREELPR